MTTNQKTDFNNYINLLFYYCQLMYFHSFFQFLKEKSASGICFITNFPNGLKVKLYTVSLVYSIFDQAVSK